LWDIKQLLMIENNIVSENWRLTIAESQNKLISTEPNIKSAVHFRDFRNVFEGSILFWTFGVFKHFLLHFLGASPIRLFMFTFLTWCTTKSSVSVGVVVLTLADACGVVITPVYY